MAHTGTDDKSLKGLEGNCRREADDVYEQGISFRAVPVTVKMNYLNNKKPAAEHDCNVTSPQLIFRQYQWQLH